MDGLAAVLSFVVVEQLARRRNDCLFTSVEPYLQRAVLCEIVVRFKKKRVLAFHLSDNLATLRN